MISVRMKADEWALLLTMIEATARTVRLAANECEGGDELYREATGKLTRIRERLEQVLAPHGVSGS